MENPFVTSDQPPVQPVYVEYTPVQARPAPAPAQNTTDFKTRKVVLAILSIISLSIGYLALVIGSAPALLLAIPCIGAGVLIGWNVLRMKDYSDAKELQKYRNEAAYQPLVNTAKEHGWDMMIQYGIPKQEDFNRLVTDRVKHYRFQSGTIIQDYEFLKGVRDRLTAEGKHAELDILHPSQFKAQFDAEVQRLTKSDIFEKYNIEQLCQYGLLPESELNVYQNSYLRGLKYQKDEKAAAEKTFREDFNAILDSYQQSLMSMTIGHDHNRFLNTEYQFVRRLRANPLTPINPNMHFNHAGQFEAQYEARKRTLEILQQIQEARKIAMERIDTEFNRTKESINNPQVQL